MKIFVSRLAALSVILAFSLVCNAQGVPGPLIAKGSIIVYDVKENKSSYQYTVTVAKFGEADGVELKWTTNEKSPRSGTTTMAFTNLDNATKLKIKLVPGKEKLDEDQLRIFFSNDIVVTLVGKKNADIDIDGKEDNFLYLATKDEKAEIDYNGSKTTVDYTSGDAGDVSVGFTTIGDYQVVNTYRSKDLSLTLKSINSK